MGLWKVSMKSEGAGYILDRPTQILTKLLLKNQKLHIWKHKSAYCVQKPNLKAKRSQNFTAVKHHISTENRGS